MVTDILILLSILVLVEIRYIKYRQIDRHDILMRTFPQMVLKLG